MHVCVHCNDKGSDEKLRKCKEFGADVGINYKTQDFAVEVLSVTNNKGSLYNHMYLYAVM